MGTKNVPNMGLLSSINWQEHILYKTNLVHFLRLKLVDFLWFIKCISDVIRLVAGHFSEGLFKFITDALQLLLFLVQLVLKTVNLGRQINCLKSQNKS